MPYMVMKHDVDPKKTILDAIGDISEFEIFNNKILVAVYLRPEKTKSGILLPDQHRDEDKYQGKVGLILKMGASAFDDPSGEWFKGIKFNVHDWIIMRPSDGWSITINGVLCRVLDDMNVQGRSQHPDQAW